MPPDSRVEIIGWTPPALTTEFPTASNPNLFFLDQCIILRANESRWLDTEDSGNDRGRRETQSGGKGFIELGHETVGMEQDLEILVDWRVS